MNAVEIRNLRVSAGGRELLALPQLQVRAGEQVVVVGANGAGKSTLLRCLGGFVRPQADLLQGALRAWRSEVGQVLQGLHLVARLSALDNTLIGALGRLRGADAWRSCWRHYPPHEVQAALQALQAVGLAARADVRADRLSGGERQKVAMARVLLQQPRLVLADEPTASLDPAATREAIALLRQVATNATLITIVHDPALVPLLGDRVLGLRSGTLVLDGPVAALDSAALARLYAGTA